LDHTIYQYSTLRKHCGTKCCSCGSENGIEYHHIIPLSFSGQDRLSNIIAVCSDCHALVHFGEHNEISHSEATKRGVDRARKAGKQIGRKKGAIVETSKSIKAKGLILAMSKDFRGYQNDREVIVATGISRNTYYKYKKELKREAEKYGILFAS